MFNMLLQATITRNYFVKTQTSVASFGPPDLSIIFSNGIHIVILGICVFQSQLLFIQYFVKTITVIGEHKCRVLEYDENLRET